MNDPRPPRGSFRFPGRSVAPRGPPESAPRATLDSARARLGPPPKTAPVVADYQGGICRVRRRRAPAQSRALPRRCPRARDRRAHPRRRRRLSRRIRTRPPSCACSSATRTSCAPPASCIESDETGAYRSTALRPSPPPSTSPPRRPPPCAPPARRCSRTRRSPTPTTCASRSPRSPRASTPALCPPPRDSPMRTPRARDGRGGALLGGVTRQAGDASSTPTPTATARRTTSSPTGCSCTTGAGTSWVATPHRDEVRTYAVARIEDACRRVRAAGDARLRAARPTSTCAATSGCRSSTAPPPTSSRPSCASTPSTAWRAESLAAGQGELADAGDGSLSWRVTRRVARAAAALRARERPGHSRRRDRRPARRRCARAWRRWSALMPRANSGDSARRLIALLGQLTPGHVSPGRGPRRTRSARPTAQLADDLETLCVCGVAPYTPDQMVDVFVDDGMRRGLLAAARRERAGAARRHPSLGTCGGARRRPASPPTTRSPSDCFPRRRRRLRRRRSRAHAAKRDRDPRQRRLRDARLGGARARGRRRSPTRAKATAEPTDRVTSSRSSSSPSGARGTSRRGAGPPAACAPSASTASAPPRRPASGSSAWRCPSVTRRPRRSRPKGCRWRTLRFAPGEPFVAREWPGGRVVSTDDDGATIAEVPFGGTGWIARRVVARLGTGRGAGACGGARAAVAELAREELERASVRGV